MPSFEDLIRHENEHSALDFKAHQYRKESHEALLKDILSMANADVPGDRHLVIGVKHRPDGSRTFVGIEPSDFVDPAIYQELVRANIEPTIELDYIRVDLDEHTFAVLRIVDCHDPPYLMKKDFGSLRLGDGFIRKGSHQARLTRADIDRMVARKTVSGPADSDILVSFDPDQPLERLTVDPLLDLQLPSRRAAAKIKAILAERDQRRKGPSLSKFGPATLASMTMPSIFGRRPYHLRPDDELRKNLEAIDETYQEDDLYELYERLSFKLNLHIRNRGDRYVEDAGIELIVPRIDGLLIADQIYPEPVRDWPYGVSALHRMPLPYTYPLVEKRADSFLVRDQIGEIKHQRVTEAFGEPVRVVFGPQTAGQELSVTCRIHAKNLPTPVTRVLTVAVVPDQGQSA